MSNEGSRNSSDPLIEEEGSSSDHEILDIADEMSHQANKEQSPVQSIKSSRRGRKKIPKRWTRIIKVDVDDETDI